MNTRIVRFNIENERIRCGQHHNIITEKELVTSLFDQHNKYPYTGCIVVMCFNHTNSHFHIVPIPLGFKIV
jgi:hypothetical protein